MCKNWIVFGYWCSGCGFDCSIEEFFEKEIFEMKVHNRTEYTIDQIREMPLLKMVRNEWRRRNINLHQHPTKPDSVISAGITFDEETVIICEEKKTDWSRELSSPKHIVTIK